MADIILKFDLDTGDASVEAMGFKGKTCSAAMEFLKKALGSCRDFRRKSEWYETNIKSQGQIHSNHCG